MTPEEMISLWAEEEKHLLKMPDFDAMCPVTPKEYGSRISAFAKLNSEFPK